ncbi:MAG: NAD(P)H-dependent oxidoreductase [Bosea sp.]|uniref:NADPH-dependent FMN reductase n=1 Tax=Bosea sp. (in: a-proteobacteria) TaxID=1871050 RepID=UPI001ACDDFCD|nr:NAD(P)H-dependent oxidoreductase [Bosea sp. (in: a-proteobacteria)]MBN9449168.1 NAD(P)H-dependent oxidoreductase [Bosea sp. (in: a-proteobacteria)]MBN9471907.1 NAD(P)H-dependent oxidoreductase [Bosea sp. (in: a-proteobacteria)]
MHRRLTHSIHLAVIYGSSREGRLCDKIAGWTLAQVEGEGPFSVEAVDPAAHDLAEVKARLGRADAFIVVTPEYNRSFPAPLKAIIDDTGPEWRGKPVAFVSYGGVSGGLRAVEQLRLVFAELHAATIRDGVCFANAWNQFDEAGRLADAERAERAMATMLGQLHWWASALRSARNSVPYGQFAA